MKENEMKGNENVSRGNERVFRNENECKGMNVKQFTLKCNHFQRV